MVSKKGEIGKANVKKKASSKKVVSVKKKAIVKLKAEVKKSKDAPETKKTVATDKAGALIQKQSVKKNESVSSSSVLDKVSVSSHAGSIGVFKNGVARATGHRKRAIAKVACREDSGKVVISVNNFDYKQFFTKLVHQEVVSAPFVLLGIKTGYVVNAEVFGGGKSGQADALKLGLSRCLALMSDEYAKILRKNSFLTRDARKVEPKKAGLKKARKKEQFSKR